MFENKIFKELQQQKKKKRGVLCQSNTTNTWIVRHGLDAGDTKAE